MWNIRAVKGAIFTRTLTCNVHLRFADRANLPHRASDYMAVGALHIGFLVISPAQPLTVPDILPGILQALSVALVIGLFHCIVPIHFFISPKEQ
jgi:hypothetical protein